MEKKMDMVYFYSHKGSTFKIIAGTLTDLSYTKFFRVLDGRYYVLQHKERIRNVGFRKQINGSNIPFTFPSKDESELIFRSILENDTEDGSEVLIPQKRNNPRRMLADDHFQSRVFGIFQQIQISRRPGTFSLEESFS